jgi:dephospho-CoA kinase
MTYQADRRLRIGLTGGIASGKSLVANCFAELGVPVIDTDQVARDVVAPEQPALREIRECFGAGVISADGRLDRRALRKLVFADDARRGQLEQILHPLIRRETLTRAAAAGGPYHLIVVPLLLETGFDTLIDRVLVVDCPREMQAARLRTRDEENTAQIERMIAAQISRDERLAAADDVVDNSGSVAATRDQVEALHKRYLEIAAAS